MNQGYIDEKYVLLLSSKLQQFKKSGKNYAFRCPVCLDSQKSKTKRRGYIYRASNVPNLCFKCHNCGVSWSFGRLLEYVDGELYSAYKLERYRDGSSGRSSHKEPTFQVKFEPPKFAPRYPDLGLVSIDKLPDGDPYKDYITKRHIPEAALSQMFYVPDFKTWAQGRVTSEKYDSLIDNDPRILLPFYSPDKRLIGGQGRTIQNIKMRYITFKTDDKEELLFGMDRIDPTKIVYVVEGPIDSLFLPNCLAAAGSDLSGSVSRLSKYIEIPPENIVLVFDNEPRNKQIVSSMTGGLSKYKVVIWSEQIKQKDINDMVLAGLSVDNIVAAIQERTFSGLSGQLELNRWKRC